MKLRDYQHRCVDATIEAFNDDRATLNVMPTGTGKTITFSETIRRYCNGSRAMVIAHRDELIRQAFQKIKAVTGIEPEIEMAEYRADQDELGGKRVPVVVSSVQTQNAGRTPRMEKFDPFEFNLLIIDEAHHAPATSYRKVIDYYMANPSLRVLGVTATPDRADEAAMGQVFDSCSFDYGLIDAISDGWLVDIEQQYIHVEGLDFSEIRTTAGDLNQKDLAAVMAFEKVLHGSVIPTLELVGDRKCLLFATTVAHAERMTEIINRYRNDSAFIIHASTPRNERRELLRAYKQGRYQFMVNVGIATEGFDEPSIEVVVMCRPTKSRCLYAQMIGRGTRPLDELVDYLNDCTEPASRRQIISGSTKPNLLVIDFAGNSGRHKLVSSADILGGDYDDDVVERAARRVRENGAATNMSQELRLAKDDLEAEEKRKRARVVAKAQWSSRNVNPFDVFSIKPQRERGWDKGRPPTARMIQVLTRARVDKIDGISFADAGRLISELKRRWSKDLCTYSQAKLLQKFEENPECTMKEASQKIDAIKDNGWRRLPQAPLSV